MWLRILGIMATLTVKLKLPNVQTPQIRRTIPDPKPLPLVFGDALRPICAMQEATSKLLGTFPSAMRWSICASTPTKPKAAVCTNTPEAKRLGVNGWGLGKNGVDNEKNSRITNRLTKLCAYKPTLLTPTAAGSGAATRTSTAC